MRAAADEGSGDWEASERDWDVSDETDERIGGQGVRVGGGRVVSASWKEESTGES